MNNYPNPPQNNPVDSDIFEETELQMKKSSIGPTTHCSIFRCFTTGWKGFI